MNIISKEEFKFMEFTIESNVLNDLYDICYPKKHKRIPYKYGKHSYRKEVK